MAVRARGAWRSGLHLRAAAGLVTAAGAWAASAIIAAAVAMQPPSPSALPPLGLAVEEDNGRWCAAFPLRDRDRLHPGDAVAIVFPDGAEALVWSTRIGALLERPCRTAFPQPRWADYAFWSLERSSAGDSSAVGARKTLGLAAATDVPWRRTSAGVLRADLDGDRQPEEARRCAADEGEHFTVWTLRAGGASDRRAHEYFDWGAVTDPTCGSGEDGR